MANQFTIDDYYDIVVEAESYPEARGTAVYWFPNSNNVGQGTYTEGRIKVIVDNDMQASAYSDISMELFGHPNEIDISEGYSGLRDATHSTRI
jgi:hypothetical protein